MQITFLEADRPLVKSYALDSEGNLIKESYPRVWNFTSHTMGVNSLKEMAEVMRGAAAKGFCLLKGEVQRRLVSESRAGSTDPNTPTKWICLDFDRLGKVSLTQAIGLIGLSEYDRIVQYSASHGVEPAKGDTAHVIIELSVPLHPASLKQWLVALNLKIEALREHLELTATHNSISWGLDVSTCQNDKLIYIAPPNLGPGVQSTYEGDRIQFVQGTRPTLDPASLTIPTIEANRTAMQAALEELRSEKGLPARKWTLKTDKSTGLELLAKPDAATLTGLKYERGFTYFNLNGGDSWGYYSSDSAPHIVRNFKGEPDYLTAELLPEFWAQTQAKQGLAKSEQKQALQQDGLVQGVETVLVFRDFKSAIYYNGTWNSETQVLNLARAASETQLQHFLKERGLPEIDFIPTWNLVFDPHSDVRVDPERRILNTFQPSIYMKQEPSPVDAFPDACPTIHKVISHAVAHDEALLDHFINTVAVIFRLRIATKGAWALHGVQGTGKGLLVNKILMPLLGASNVAVRRMSELEDRFNGYLETALVAAIDEAQISESRQSKMIMADLKNMITEPQISIRRMHTAAYTVPNHCNFLFLTNQPDPIMIEASDRRFNVGEFRDTKLVITDAEVDQIQHEIGRFADVLYAYDMSAERARTVMVTDERAIMIATSTNSIDTTSEALRQGDIEFFWDALPAGEQGLLGPEQSLLHDAYCRLMHGALRSENGVQRLTRDELRILFAYNIGDVSKTPAKFTSMLRHHRVHLVPMRIDGRVVRGCEVTWKADPEWIAERLAELQKKQPGLRAVA